MTVTPQDIYQLIKSYEGQFTPPAPYVTINVGTLDVDSGAFNGLTTERSTDPEPIEHGPHDTPHSPPGHFVGARWIKLTIGNDWKPTTTIIPAPQVALAPVLLSFAISHPIAAAWSVSVNGETVQVNPGQTSVAVNIWDAANASWRVEAGGKSYADTMLIQRPGNLGGALGGLTIPVLPVSIVYAPPVDSLRESVASYTEGQTIGDSATLDMDTDTVKTVNTEAFGLEAFELWLQAATAGLTAGASEGGVLASDQKKAAGYFSDLSSQLGQLDASQTSGISDESKVTLTNTTSTSTALSTSAAAGGPGAGDLIHFYQNVLLAWGLYEGQLRLVPLGYTERFYPAAAVSSQAATIGISAEDAQALLALDPFVAGGPAAVLPADRFNFIANYGYGFGAKFELNRSFTRETNFETTSATYTTKTDGWQPGPILKALGFGSSETTTTKLSNATGQKVSKTVTMDANLWSGPNDNFVINLWYDKLFGTFAFQLDQLASVPSLQGDGAQPNQKVTLSAGGKVFVTVADRKGHYAFYARGIPHGHAILTIGNAASQVVEVGA
jgi:hypothetical protein